MLLGKNPCKLQVFHDRVDENVGMRDRRFAPWKCKMLLQDWNGWKPNLVLVGDELDTVGRFSRSVGMRKASQPH